MAAGGFKQAQDNVRESWHPSDRGFLSREGWRARDSLQDIKQLTSAVFYFNGFKQKTKIIDVFLKIRGFI